MDESADDPMFDDVNYSKDNKNSYIILLGEADDAKNEQIDNPIKVRSELCYSNIEIIIPICCTTVSLYSDPVTILFISLIGKDFS
uniref:Uncharacterized protein n=1 Tax=Panagrolaimus davidi TaxID=227884 RepID=A0A914RB93_9BILA